MRLADGERIALQIVAFLVVNSRCCHPWPPPKKVLDSRWQLNAIAAPSPCWILLSILSTGCTIVKMRTSRISKDTVRLFDKASPTAASTSRRTTRSLSRFAYASPSTTTTPDIEDAIASPPAKRRRKLSTTSPVKAEKIVKVEKKEEVEEYVDIKASVPAAKKQRKPARKTTNATTGELHIEPPSDWEAMYELIRKMRAPGGAAYGAAVDTMGCERLADRDASPKDQRFHTLIALMLSSQTKDTTNAAAMKRLKTELPPHKPGAPIGLNLDNILAVEPKLLNELIWAVGFHNNKTK